MNYPGSKNGSGCYQQIINQLPPHDLYVELFAGSAAVLRKKRPAVGNIAIDADAAAVAALRESSEIPAGTTIIHGDVIRRRTRGRLRGAGILTICLRRCRTGGFA